MSTIPPGESAELVTDHDPHGRYNFRVTEGYGYVARTEAEAARRNGQYRETDDRGYWEVPADESVWAYNPGDTDFAIEVEKQGFFTHLFSPQRAKTDYTVQEERDNLDDFTTIDTINANDSYQQTYFTIQQPDEPSLRIMGVSINLFGPLPDDVKPDEVGWSLEVTRGDGSDYYQIGGTLRQPTNLFPEGARPVVRNDNWEAELTISNFGDTDIEVVTQVQYQLLER